MIEASKPTALSDLDEELVEFNRARFKQELSLGIFNLMEDQDVKPSMLARILGVSRPRISHMLSGEHQNFRADTLADLFLVLGRALHITLGADPDELRIPVDEMATLTNSASQHFSLVQDQAHGEETSQNASAAIQETNFTNRESIGAQSIAGNYRCAMG